MAEEALPIVRGYQYSLRMAVTGGDNPVFPEGAKLRAQVREYAGAPRLLAELTFDNGGLRRVSNDSVDMVLSEAATRAIGNSSAVVEFSRTDVTPFAYLYIMLRIPVMKDQISAPVVVTVKPALAVALSTPPVSFGGLAGVLQGAGNALASLSSMMGALLSGSALGGAIGVATLQALMGASLAGSIAGSGVASASLSMQPRASLSGLAAGTALNAASLTADVAAMPLRTVSMRGESNKTTVATTSSTQQIVGRSRDYIATDATEIRGMVTGYWLDVNGDTPTGNAYTAEMGVEINGIGKAFTWGGQTGAQIASGEAFCLTDPLAPSDFGLTGGVFPKGTLVWRRLKVKALVVGDKFPIHVPSQYTNKINGENFITGPIESTHDVAGTGTIGATTGWTVANLMVMPNALIGRPVSDKELFQLVFGASGEDGVDEQSGDGLKDAGTSANQVGGGSYRRALAQTMTPRIMAAKGSQSAQAWLAASDLSIQLVQFAPDVDHGHVGNDYTNNPSITPAAALARVRQIDTKLKANGARSIVSIGAVVKNNRIDSAGAWVQANLVPRSGFAKGGSFRDPFNAGRKQDVADGMIDGYVGPDSGYVNLSAPDLFRDNFTADGTHNLAAGHAGIEPLLIDYLQGKRTAIRAGQKFSVPNWEVAPVNALAGSATGSGAVSATLSGSPATGYESEANTLFAAMTTQPTDARKTAMNNFIKTLKDAGIWATRDVMHVPRAGHDAQSALLNWRAPANKTAALLGSASFVAGKGLATTTAASSYVDTAFNPATQGVSFLQDSANFGFAIEEGAAAVTSSIAGFFDGTKGVTVAPQTGTQATVRINQANSKVITNGRITTGNQLFVLDRSSANDHNLYVDGVSLGVQSDASLSPASGNLRLGSISGTTSVARTFGLGMAGGSMSAAQHQTLATAYASLKSALA